MSDDEQHEGSPGPSAGGSATPPPGFGAAAWPPSAAADAAGAAPPAPPTVPFAAVTAPPPTRSPKRSILPVALLAVAVVALVAFGARQALGGDDGPGAPADAAEQVATAVDDADPAAYCELLAPERRAAVEEGAGQPCVEALRTAFADLESSDPGPLEIEGVERDGDRATVTYRWAPGEGELQLVVVDGEWRLATDLTAEIGPNAAPTGSGPATGPTGLREVCLTEQRTIETAVAAYEAMNLEEPADAQALVDAGILRDLPEHAIVGADGTVTMTGDCA